MTSHAKMAGSQEKSLADHVELFDVEGMTCGACAARIQKRLNRIDGVQASVNYASERAVVTMPPSMEPATVMKEVENAGFRATLRSTTRGSIGTASSGADDAERSLKRRMFVALALVMPLMDGTILFSFYPQARFTGWEWVMAALALPVVTWCAWPFYKAAFNAARHRTSTMDTLVTVGIASASIVSIGSMFWPEATEQTLIYFDVSAGVVLFLLAGRYFEARMKRHGREALESLASMAATSANLVTDSGLTVVVDSADLRIGDQFMLRPGETVPTDGVVVKGVCTLDASAMTGESVPVEVEGGDTVAGGTLCVDGLVVVDATAVGSETQLGQMIQLVEDAQNTKANAQRLADQISAYFVPTTFVISALTFIGWAVFADNAVAAFNSALAVLIIACPCALGLATPTALMVASGTAAKLGVFFKGHQAIELTNTVDTVIFDKTGTLTHGMLRVVEVFPAPGHTRDSVIEAAASVERASSHPVAQAIVRSSAATHFVDLTDVRIEASQGVSAVVGGSSVLVGTLQLLANSGVEIDESIWAASKAQATGGLTSVGVAVASQFIGLITLRDTVREEAQPAISDLRRLGLDSVMLTGDDEQRALLVAHGVGVRDTTATADPASKAAAVRSLQAAGHSVAMVGDGINDAPALAAADLGIALGSGTDVAVQTADIIISGENLRLVGVALLLARRTNRVIRTNLFWAFGYNVLAIPIAAAGLLNPLISGAAMAFSSAFVVWNSARLRRVAPRSPLWRR